MYTIRLIYMQQYMQHYSTISNIKANYHACSAILTATITANIWMIIPVLDLKVFDLHFDGMTDEDIIGKGGFGIVYRMVVHGTQVAVKKMVRIVCHYNI